MLEPKAPFDVASSICQALKRGVDLTLFPFDTQLCELQYGSWAQNGGRVNYTLMVGRCRLTASKPV
jgi:hypothetical protein